MWARILIGGIVGGILVFFTGAFNHMALGLQGRTILDLPDEPTVVNFVKQRELKPGLYGFPAMPKDEKDQSKAYAETNERYKAGPAGFLLIAPTGEDMMGPQTLGLELLTDIVAALAASWIVSLMAADVGFVRRWLAVFLMGLFAWFSITASYGIWYRFPHNFVHDELFCAAIEWGVAGLAIAGIVRRPAATNIGVKPTV
jgi:hypothetical protein